MFCCPEVLNMQKTHFDVRGKTLGPILVRKKNSVCEILAAKEIIRKKDL